MSLFREVFTRQHVVLPVVHVESENQALRNAKIAREFGCDGVFLINHGISARRLLEIFTSVYEVYADWWIGVNCLDLRPADTFRAVPRGVAGIWVDNAGIDERTRDQPFAEEVASARTQSEWRGLYFGGVAFKYQRHVEQLTEAAQIAGRYMDVVTTSGPGTGQAAHRDKIATMRRAIGEFPLAIASGITPENVADYLDVADCFLIATGISETFSELDSALVQKLVQNVRAFDAVAPAAHRAPGSPRVRSVCFICEWNEGRSVHLELSVRKRLREAGSEIKTLSAGLSQGGTISPLRQKFLAERGVPEEEIAAHRSVVFCERHMDADLIFVSELPMKERILHAFPELSDRLMTVRGFLDGFTPENENLTAVEAHIEDAAGHTDEEKITLYKELEIIAAQVADRLMLVQSGATPAQKHAAE